jgi:transposase, IS5 family
LKNKGYLARASVGSKRFFPEGKKGKREGREVGQIIDATIVSAPKQHNSREENETIKEGETPEDWKSKLAKNRQKDKDAHWTKKHERSYFCNQAVPVGYKNHIGVDRRHKFVRRYVVSDASVHDSQKFEDVLDTSNTASDVWAKRAKGSVKRSLMEWRAVGDSGRCHIVERRTREICVPNIFKRPRLPRATCS